VYQEAGGRIAGFLGVVPRRMWINGRSVQAAISSNFAVDAGSRGLAGAMLMKAVLNGPQDVSIADESNLASRMLWEGLGGATSLLYSMRWIYPLRPCKFALSISRKKNILPAFVSTLAAPAALAVDTLLGRFPASPFRPSKPRLREEELDCSTLADCLADVSGQESLHSEYDHRSLNWVLQRAGQMRRNGRLQKVLVRTETRAIAGCYIYYLTTSGISEVVLLSAKSHYATDVLDHLFHNAWRLGAAGLSGRLDPRLMHAFSARHCLFHCGPQWTLVHSRRPEVLRAFDRGDVCLSRLEGEWCLHFR
jgi:hypothetical protein